MSAMDFVGKLSFRTICDFLVTMPLNTMHCASGAILHVAFFPGLFALLQVWRQETAANSLDRTAACPEVCRCS